MQVLFKDGKACKGYFICGDILKHAATAADILDKGYPDEEHVLIFDNITTHSKQEEDALSVTKMPKFMTQSGKNWGVEVPELDGDCNIVHGGVGRSSRFKSR